MYNKNIREHIKLEPRDWQIKAYNKWCENNRHGTIKAVTGSGKSLVGIMGLVNYFYYLNQTKKIYIIVKTKALQNQWVKNVKNLTDIDEKHIGLIGNGMHDDEIEGEDRKRIIVAIINSLRRVIVDEGLLILDECHNYCSEENFKFINRSSFEQLMAISATPECMNIHLLKDIAPFVYQYDLQDARDDDVVSEFKIVNIGVKFTNEEEIEYREKHDKVCAMMKEFGYDLNRILRSTFHESPHIRMKAQNTMRVIASRKRIIFSSKNKMLRLTQLISDRLDNCPNDKFIIFSEQINTSKDIVRAIKVKMQANNKIKRPVLFNSKVVQKKQDEAIEKFKNNTANILVVVKSFDEGMDVPDANIG
ncbi:MAG: DEAD/DEAH box helicase family protein, partial [Candidatus Pacebacteria bacterium]|nr:DEAD/DEAH box helicase family protein [Candidatus Paceibacterota bacterium]